MNKERITFPDLPVAFDCSEYEFFEVKGMTKCGNIDAYMVNGEFKGQVLSFLISVPALLTLHDKHRGEDHAS